MNEIRCRWCRWGIVLALLLHLSIGSAEDPSDTHRQMGLNKGTLIVGGGGTLSDEIYDRFVTLAGGESGRLVLIPTATGDDKWLSDAQEMEAYIDDWKSEGIPSVTVLHTRDRGQASNTDFVRPLRDATAIWLGGGDQALLEQAYLGTLVEKEIHGVLSRGGVVGGSSAGAAIQSRVMIRSGGDQPEIGTGFDLVPGAIVDQHFLRRNRVNRLLEAVRRHPDRVGIGIDEGTALLVQGNRLEVIGSSYVVLVTTRRDSPCPRIRTLANGESVQLNKSADRHTMTKLQEALNSSLAAQRESALDQLIRAHHTAPGFLSRIVGLLDDQDSYVAGKAATALSLYDDQAFAEIKRILPQGSAQAKWGATIALSKMTVATDAFLPELTQQLTEGHHEILPASLAALARLKTKAVPALPALKGLLKHDDAEIRWATLHTLAAIGPAANRLLPDVMPLMRDDLLEVRLAAATAIQRIQPPIPMAAEQLVTCIEWLNDHVLELIGEYHVPGVSIAMIQQGKVNWAQGFGVCDARHQRPVTTDTVFEACSMSKPVMALSVLQLIQERQLELDRPLTDYLGHDYLPGQPEHRRITARMAMTHRTGFPNWRTGYDDMGGPLPALFPPGSDYLYSGEGIVFLQRAMEAITDMPLDRYARQGLFEPLGLARTSFVWTEVIEEDLASGHHEDGRFKSKTHYRKANGAYSLYTTPTEYAQLMLTLINPAVLRDRAFTQESIDLMLQRHQRVDVGQPITRPGLAQVVDSYRALGWSIDVSAEGDLIQHSGSNSSGFKAFGQFNVRKGSGLVIFTNGDSGKRLRDAILERIGDL